MTPVTVRFTPDAAELGRVRAAFSKGFPKRSNSFAIVLAVGFLLQGVLNITIGHGSPLWYLGWMQTVIGIFYVPIVWVMQSTNRLLGKPSADQQLTLDDAGITIVTPPLRIAWQRIAAIRDVGEAFVAVRTVGQSIPILKRSLPDDGSALWASLEEKLTATRYLIRGSDSIRNIANTAARS